MTVQTIREPIPDEFPPATLFLDDLEEITTILRDLVEKSEPKDPIPEAQTQLTFTCEGRQCTTLEEVPKILKPRRQLALEIRRDWIITSLRFSPILPALWFALVPGVSHQNLSAHLRLRPIFERRKRHITAFAHSLPRWTFWGYTLTITLAELFAHFTKPRIGTTLAHLPGLIVAATSIFLFSTFLIPRSPVLPRNSYDPSPARKLLTEKAVPIILAALLGVLGTLLTQFLVRKIWPSH